MPEQRGVVDLSTLSKKKTPEEAALDGLSEEEKQAVEALAEKAPEEGHACRTAFLVVVETDGTVNVLPDLTTALVRDHLPNADELYSAAAVVQRDVASQQTAQMTALTLHQTAMQAQQRLQAAQLAQQLQASGGLRQP